MLSLSAILGLSLLLGACKPGEQNCATPSGLPVPRFVALKFNEVNARKGPGEDYAVQWVWHGKGLPVKVVAETSDWRKVAAADGSVAWVNKRLVDGRRMALRFAPGAATMRAEPKDGAKVVAWLAPHAIAVLERCDKGWCRLKASGVKGWVRQDEVWGGAPPPVCVARPK
jgi:SH3-like domain-containing protein